MRLKLPDFGDPNVRFRLLLYAGAMAIFGLLFIASIFPLASNPTFCGVACHSQNPEYKSWQKSSHSKVTCYACHVDPTYTHLLKEKLIAGPMGIIGELTGDFEKPINEASHYSQESVPSKRCLRCHDPEARSFTSSLGLNVTSKMHTKHLDVGLDCTTCHNRVAHMGAGKYEPLKSWEPGFKYKDFMTMRDGCWRCHVDDEKYRDEETLAKVGGVAAPTNCDACHNSEYALKPITGEYDHNDVDGLPWSDGKRRHGPVAKADFNACAACHPKEAGDPTGSKLPNCTSTCHKGITMPHNTPQWASYFKEDTSTPLWLRAHAYVADELGVVATVNFRASDSKGACTMCHDKEGISANFCQKCHHQEFDEENNQPNAPWKEQHFLVVGEIGSSACQKCHLLEFCAFCHTNGKAPARGMFLNRRQQAVPVDEKILGDLGSE